MALLLAVNFGAGFFVQRFIFHGDRPTVDPITISRFVENVLVINLLMMVLEAIVIAAVAVSIHRIILFGDRKPGVWFNFPFGGTEFRYVLMGVVSFLIVASVVAAVMAPVLYLLSGGDIVAFLGKLRIAQGQRSVSPQFWEIVATYLVALLFALYFVLRLLVWPPAIVATRRFALGEAWRLTRGNVWRLFGLCLLVVFVFYLSIVGILGGAAYWYYTTKMKPESTGDETRITEMVQQMPTGPAAVPGTPPGQTPEDRAAALREKTQSTPQEAKPAAAPTPQQTEHAPDAAQTESNTSQGEKPAASPAPSPDSAAPGAAPPAAPTLDADDTVDPRDKAWERLMAPYQAYVPLMWFVDLIFYILATGFGVALLSYSYKALKGYEIYEPIPEDDA